MNVLPLVTIVTPTYEAAHWLPQCRASVLAQSYPRIEHVIVDAGSRDGTVALLDSWSGVRWVSEPDDGQSDAINKGVAMSRGDIVTWLNADDELVPDAVERVVHALSTRAAEWVVGSAEIRESGQSRVVTARRVTVRRLDVTNPIVQPSSFYTRELFDRVGGLDPMLHLAMDLDLWLRFLAAGVRPVVLDAVLSVAHLHEDAKTRAVPAARWYREMGLARAKNARTWAASVEFGRGLAEECAQSQDRVTARELRTRVIELQDELQRQSIAVARWPLRAGAATRLAALHRSRSGKLRHLARAEVWTTPQTLQEVVEAATTRLSGLRQRDRQP